MGTSTADRLQTASINVMTTLYIRDVPDAVAATLKERAASAGQSLSAYVSAQHTALAERPTNAEVVERLRSRHREGGVTPERILEALDSSRR